MTRFQAKYVLWLRHERYNGCSWRALDGNYHERYTYSDTLIPIENRLKYDGWGGNQICGMELEKEASKILYPNLSGELIDLYDCDVSKLSVNIKNIK